MAFGVIAAVTTIAGTAVSAYGSYKAGKKQEKAGELDAKITRLQNFQKRREFVSDFRRSLASATNAGYVGGLEGESSRSGSAQSQLTTQARVNLAEANTINRLGGSSANLRADAYRYANVATLGSSVASVASQFITPGNFRDKPEGEG